MIKVLVGGTFDFLHPGHIQFLKKARSMGDSLIVVVSSDEYVQRVGKKPFNSARDRLDMIESLNFVDKAVLGDSNDPLKTVQNFRPDIVFLGYDQKVPPGLESLSKELGFKIVRDSKGYFSGYYKSTQARLKILSEISHLLSLSHLAHKNANQCPWVLNRTGIDFINHLKDEISEVESAVEKRDWKNLEEELGDVLWNVLNAIYVCEREGFVDGEAVFKGIFEKILRRKPFLVDGRKVSAEDAERMWSEAKKKEKS